MFSSVYSGGILAVEGYLVHVEADVGNGLPGMSMVGYLASEVKEAQDRVKSALRNSDFFLPPKKIVINLSPADIRKEGTAFDLPVAISILSALGLINPELLRSSMIVGELGLDGCVKTVKGTLSLVAAAKQAGLNRCFVPIENLEEGTMIEGIEVIGVESLADLVSCLNHPKEIHTAKLKIKDINPAVLRQKEDFSDINGQLILKRATELAVAGGHNLLMLGPAGVGKTMVAKRIPTIMPSISPMERLEILKIYSVYGLQPPGGSENLCRPFRSPHHTISPHALAGGGTIPKPGELSLASRGILFLDEFPEFKKNTIEILRQPLEEHKIIISRLHGTYQFPAHILLVAAMNPCPCGCYPDRNRCSCTSTQIKNYLERISKPILERMDICAEASPVTFESLTKVQDNETSVTIKQRIEAARTIQKLRFQSHNILTNSEMGMEELKEYCSLGEREERFLKQIFETMDFSPRTYHKILKVARTIADLEGERNILHEHLCEAVSYRGLEQKYWNREELRQ